MKPRKESPGAPDASGALAVKLLFIGFAFAAYFLVPVLLFGPEP